MIINGRNSHTPEVLQYSYWGSVLDEISRALISQALGILQLFTLGYY